MDDVHGDYPPGIGDDIGTPTIADDFLIHGEAFIDDDGNRIDPALVHPTWGDIAAAPLPHHYLYHTGTQEGHHHHGTDGSVLHHNHDGWLYTDDFSGEPVQPDHDHEFNVLSIHNGIFYGPADHDHDTPTVPHRPSDVRT